MEENSSPLPSPFPTNPAPERPAPPVKPMQIVMLVVIGIVLLSVAVIGLANGRGTPEELASVNSQPTLTQAKQDVRVSPFVTTAVSTQPVVAEVSLSSVHQTIIFDTWGKNTPLVSNFSGQNNGLMVDSKHPAAFAGWSDDGKAIYFIELNDTTATLYKRDLTTGLLTQLMHFESGNKNTEFLPDNASVSPDGIHVAYGHDNGDVSVYDLGKRTTKLLAHQLPCLSKVPAQHTFSFIQPVYAGNPQTCYGYYSPHWTPDGKHLIIKKIFYEGATEVVIDPFAIAIKESDIGGGYPVWSADGKSLIVYGSGYGPGSVYLIPGSFSSTRTDILAGTALAEASVTGAVVKNDGTILFSYAPSGETVITSGIGIYKKTDKSVTVLEPTKEQYTVMGLLDENTLLLNDQLNRFWVFNLTTLTKQSLPITGNLVLAIIH